MKIKSFLKDFLEGIYSGIPLCCVISFSRGRTGLVAYKDNNISMESYYAKFPCEYVQCKSCEKLNYSVNIKKNGRLFKAKPPKGRHG